MRPVAAITVSACCCYSKAASSATPRWSVSVQRAFTSACCNLLLTTTWLTRSHGRGAASPSIATACSAASRRPRRSASASTGTSVSATYTTTTRAPVCRACFRRASSSTGRGLRSTSPGSCTQRARTCTQYRCRLSSARTSTQERECGTAGVAFGLGFRVGVRVRVSVSVAVPPHVFVPTPN